MDVLGAQAVLVAVLDEALAGIDHEDAFAPRRAGLVQHDDAGGNAGAVEQVGRQADDAFDIALLDDAGADVRLRATSEQHAVRQNHCRLAGALEALEHVQQKGVVAVLVGRNAVLEASIQVVGCIEAAGPVLVGERWIGDHEVEGLEAAVGVLEVRMR